MQNETQEDEFIFRIDCGCRVSRSSFAHMLSKKVLLVATVSLLPQLGCGGTPSSQADGREVEVIQSSLEISTDLIPQEIQDFANDAMDVVGALSSAKDYFSAAVAFLQSKGLLSKPPSEFERLIDEINKVGVALDWKATALERNNQWSALHSGEIAVAGVDTLAGQRLDPMGTVNADSRTAALAAGGLVMFQRFFVEAATDDDPNWRKNAINFDWKNIIKDRLPEVTAQNQVFDWRIGLPWFLQAIAMRLKVIVAVDPFFQVNGNASIQTELTSLRNMLSDVNQRMIAGVRCADKGFWGSGIEERVQGTRSHTSFRVACADVNTGLNVTQWVSLPVPPKCSKFVPEAKATFINFACVKASDTGDLIGTALRSARAAVLNAMPTFATRAVIDDLGKMITPGPDLTEGTSSIRAAANPGLCLDVQWGNANAGTPVWLWPCTGDVAQQWQYNRTTRLIWNPNFNKCLDVQWGQPVAAVPVWTWDCTGNPAQQWSYDPISRVLQNALGTVLDIQWGVVQQQTPVWTWTRDEGFAQQWN